MPRRAATAPSSAGRSTRRSRSCAWPSSAKATPKKQLEIAEQVQKRILEQGVTVPLGQFLQPMARRKGVTGNIESPVTVFWNVEKK